MHTSNSQLLPSVVIFASLGIVQASLSLPSLIAKIPNSPHTKRHKKKRAGTPPDSPFLNFCNKREQRSSLQLPSIAIFSIKERNRNLFIFTSEEKILLKKIMSASNNPHSTTTCSPTPTTHFFHPSPSSRAQKYLAPSSYQSYTPTHSTAYQDKVDLSDEYLP